MKETDGTRSMSREELIQLSLSAAPPEIAEGAAVMIPDENGKMMEVRSGTNGFTCIPTVNQRSKPDPMCMDEATGQWVNDLVNKAPKPTHTVPGISYLARGGYHWEKDGKVLMEEEPGAKLVKEPPHWMIMWPFDAKASGLPDLPHKFGAWVMFDGTPYAPMMVHQNPKKIKIKKREGGGW